MGGTVFKKILLFLLLFSFSYSKNYTLFLASTKYVDVAEKYYHDVRFHTPDFYDVVIRTHIKKNYSVIIRQIPTIEKTKKIQKLLHAANKYQDSYIKMYNTEPKYNVLEIEDKLVTIKAREKIYQHNIENSNNYISASVMYNTKQYNESYKLFHELFLKNNYNLNINYFLAKSAFFIKKYDEATAAFERVLILKPDFNQARYDYARILYKLNQKNEAKSEFTKLLKTKINKKTKSNIKNYLKNIKQKKKKKRISGNATVLLGLSRSSNVNNGLISPEYRLPGLNDILVEGEEPIADSAHFEAISLNFYTYFKTQPIRTKNSFLVYNKSFLNQKDENITVLSYKPSLSYFDIKNKNSYEIELSVDKIIKKTDDNFYAFSISPKIRNKDYYTYLKYQRIMYSDEENEDKDFEKVQFYVQLNLFKNMNYYLHSYKNSQINDLRIDIDKYTIGNGVNLFYELTLNNKINLNYQFDYSKYKYENLAFDSKRQDENHSVELSHSYNIDTTSRVSTALSYTKNNSNQDAYLYDEKAIRINYSKSIIW